MSKFVKWLDNYWYHYKWVTIVCLFVALLVVITTVQLVNKEEKDIGIVYLGPSAISGEQASEIEFAFEQIMSSDYNGDGTKSAQLTFFNYYTDEQYEEKVEQAKKDETFFSYDLSTRNETLRQLNTLMSTGETVICLLDESVYQTLVEQDAFVSLQSVLGYSPEFALDEFSVRIGDTDFGKYYTAFDCIDPDTRLCICDYPQNTYFMNKKAIEKTYSYNKRAFCDLFAFSDGEDGDK